MATRDIRWLPILLEALFVVLGVVLALMANEWRESRSQARQAEAVLESVRQEILANRGAVLEAVTYHIQLSDTLTNLARQGIHALSNNHLFTRGYIAPPELYHTAWDAAHATGTIAYMDYEAILTLAKVYEAQRTYREQVQQSGQLIYQKLFEEGHRGILDHIPNLNTLISTFWYQECKLLGRYDETLTTLGVAADVMPALPGYCYYVLQRP